MIELTDIVAMAQPTTRPSEGGPPGWFSFMPIILLVIIFYFFLIRGKQKDQRKRKDMLAQIKKNDRVMTIGGIIGTVVSVKEDEVTLKVDETANVKLTFIRGSIQKVVTEQDSS